MEFPDGYDTIAGERGYRLSGGEKRYVRKLQAGIWRYYRLDHP